MPIDLHVTILSTKTLIKEKKDKSHSSLFLCSYKEQRDNKEKDCLSWETSLLSLFVSLTSFCVLFSPWSVSNFPSIPSLITWKERKRLWESRMWLPINDHRVCLWSKRLRIEEKEEREVKTGFHCFHLFRSLYPKRELRYLSSRYFLLSLPSASDEFSRKFKPCLIIKPCSSSSLRVYLQPFTSLLNSSSLPSTCIKVYLTYLCQLLLLFPVSWMCCCNTFKNSWHSRQEKSNNRGFFRKELDVFVSCLCGLWCFALKFSQTKHRVFARRREEEKVFGTDDALSSPSSSSGSLYTCSLLCAYVIEVWLFLWVTKMTAVIVTQDTEGKFIDIIFRWPLLQRRPKESNEWILQMPASRQLCYSRKFRKETDAGIKKLRFEWLHHYSLWLRSKVTRVILSAKRRQG